MLFFNLLITTNYTAVRDFTIQNNKRFQKKRKKITQ